MSESVPTPSHPVPTPSRTGSANVTGDPVRRPVYPEGIRDGVADELRQGHNTTASHQDQGRGQVLYRLSDAAGRLLYVGITHWRGQPRCERSWQ